MGDTDITAARLDLATRRAVRLQGDLLNRQGDLLALELSVRALRVGRTEVRAVMGQAEDIRRVFATRYAADLTEISQVLARAGVVVDQHAAAQRQSLQAHLDSERFLDTAGRHARRAAADICEVVLAMTPSAQARLGPPGLTTVAQTGVREAARALESARRAVFHLSETLPLITRGVRGLPAGEFEQLSLALATEPVAASEAPSTIHAGVELPLSLERGQNSVFTPGL